MNEHKHVIQFFILRPSSWYPSLVRGSYHSRLSETYKRRSFERRIIVVHCLFGCIVLIIVARLIELQIINRAFYQNKAQAQQIEGLSLPARRGEILSRNSKTGETSILATNTTLDLLYIDPKVITSGHADVASKLADILITKEVDTVCRSGLAECPAELMQYYQSAFDPLRGARQLLAALSQSGSLLRPLFEPVVNADVLAPPPVDDVVEIRRKFARSIEERITQKKVIFAPLVYGATKVQLAQTSTLNIPGVFVNIDQRLIYVDPQQVDQEKINDIAVALSPVLSKDAALLRNRLVRRDLRYVPIMGKLTPDMTRRIKALIAKSALDNQKIVAELRRQRTGQKPPDDPYRSLALVPEHWRFYPDTKIASHVIGFITAKVRGENAIQEPQYGIERTFDAQLRGLEGRLASATDSFGGAIVSSDQKFVDPRDGSTIVLTIDRIIQSKVEQLLEAMIKKVDAESGQVIVMDPFTGRILAMANAPLFDSNMYTSVYEKEPIFIDPGKESTSIAAEVFDPVTNMRVALGYLHDFDPENVQKLPQDVQAKIADLLKQYDLKSLMRYYLYVGEYNRREIFPTSMPSIWLKFKNNLGLGAYVNRNIQEMYEPGSVMKAVTMAIAIDQGEITPFDTYDDTGPIKIDKFIIKNALYKYYGHVTMVDCINWSINTCLTSVSKKLGRSLFYAELKKFGFGALTGIQLDNELPGVLQPLRDWNDVLLLTTAYGQGISVTPLQMITAYTALANGGKLMKPTIIDEIRHPDGTVDKTSPEAVGQVIKPETSATITSMLVNSGENGYANAGKPKNYRIAGKTGTSQIAGPGGKYETGTGSTTATFAGYAPVDHPKFIILVKLDRPKKDDFGSKSAAPLFRDIAQFLFDYYGIPPDEKNPKK